MIIKFLVIPRHCRWPMGSLLSKRLTRGRLGVVGNAQHAKATTRRGLRPSVQMVVSPTLLYPCGKAGPQLSRSRDHVNRQADGYTCFQYYITWILLHPFQLLLLTVDLLRAGTTRLRRQGDNVAVKAVPTYEGGAKDRLVTRGIRFLALH